MAKEAVAVIGCGEGRDCEETNDTMDAEEEEEEAFEAEDELDEEGELELRLDEAKLEIDRLVIEQKRIAKQRQRLRRSVQQGQPPPPEDDALAEEEEDLALDIEQLRLEQRQLLHHQNKLLRSRGQQPQQARHALPPQPAPVVQQDGLRQRRGDAAPARGTTTQRPRTVAFKENLEEQEERRPAPVRAAPPQPALAREVATAELLPADSRFAKLRQRVQDKYPAKGAGGPNANLPPGMGSLGNRFAGAPSQQDSRAHRAALKRNSDDNEAALRRAQGRSGGAGGANRTPGLSAEAQQAIEQLGLGGMFGAGGMNAGGTGGIPGMNGMGGMPGMNGMGGMPGMNGMGGMPGMNGMGGAGGMPGRDGAAGRDISRMMNVNDGTADLASILGQAGGGGMGNMGSMADLNAMFPQESSWQQFKRQNGKWMIAIVIVGMLFIRRMFAQSVGK